MRTALVLAAFAGVLAIPLDAQSFIVSGGTTSVGPFTKGPAGFQSFGQSFTAPSGSPTMQSFGIAFSNFFNGGALRFNAYVYAFDVPSRQLTGNALWSFLGSAGSSNYFGFDTQRFNTLDIPLTGGSTYLFLVTASNSGAGVPDDASNLVLANDRDEYDAGAFWAANNGSDFNALFAAGAFGTVDGISDLNFKAVFGSRAEIVPEPSTSVLSAFGMLVLLAVVRRKVSQTRHP